MTRLVLIRHGETAWNLEGRWQGQMDVPLNERGREQAARLARELPLRLRIDAIYASDLQRARETAQALADQTGLTVELDARLRETYHGTWEGLRIDTIRSRDEAIYVQRLADPWNVPPPGGESGLEVRQRVAAMLDDIAARHPNQVVAVISHGFVLAVAQTIASSAQNPDLWDLIPAHCEPVCVDWRPSRA